MQVAYSAENLITELSNFAIWQRNLKNKRSQRNGLNLIMASAAQKTAELLFLPAGASSTAKSSSDPLLKASALCMQNRAGGIKRRQKDALGNQLKTLLRTVKDVPSQRSERIRILNALDRLYPGLDYSNEVYQLISRQSSERAELARQVKECIADQSSPASSTCASTDDSDSEIVEFKFDVRSGLV